MLKRRYQAEIESALTREAAVALLGPRQAGKTQELAQSLHR